MKLKSILSVLVISLLLTSCKETEYLPLEHFNDELINVKELDDFGMAIGSSGTCYLFYGEIRLPGSNTLAGEAVARDRKFRFPIVELLKKYPNLKSPKALKAGAAQLLIIQRRDPTFYDSIELSKLGNHG